MPQGRRKTPFSGKAKKLQMQVKKQRQRTWFGMYVNIFIKNLMTFGKFKIKNLDISLLISLSNDFIVSKMLSI